MTKLSILVCAHCPNAYYDDLLVKAISSIYEQSYKDYKLLIVLDECWKGTFILEFAVVVHSKNPKLLLFVVSWTDPMLVLLECEAG